MNLRKQSGQMILEAVLIITMLFAVTGLIASFFRNEEVVKRLVSGPWQNLAGMMQNGVWKPASEGAISHPNAHGRHVVIQGDTPR
jgi:hypothetical protein